MAERRTFGQGLDLLHNDIYQLCMYGVADEPSAITYLGTTKRKIVYHAGDGGRLMYRGESANHIIAVDSDVKKTFNALNDTPAEYTGAAGNYVRVNTNPTPNGLEFRTTAQVWSDIKPATGALSASGAIAVTSGNEVIGAGATITHSTAAGYKHVPTGGESGNFLKWSANGTATWSNIVWGDIGSIPADIVYLNATQTLTNKTISADLNTIIGRAGDDAGGDLLVYNQLGNKYQRHPKGSVGQVLMSESFGVVWTNLTTSHILNFASSVRSTTLTGFTVGANTTILATDTILEAFGKTQGQVNDLYDLVSLGIHNRPACVAAFDNAGASLTTSTNTVDGVTTTAGMRVVVFNSSTAGQVNKIYEASGSAGSWTWTVQQDGTGADLPAEGHSVWVGQGTEYEDTKWSFNGTSWVQIGGTGTYTAGTGIAISTGNVISLAEINGVSVLARAANSTGVPAGLAAASNDQVLMRSSNELTFAKIKDANVDNDAAIAWSKLATGTANHVLVTNASTGVVESMSTLNVARGGTGRASLAQYSVLIGSGTGALVQIAASDANTFLVSNGASSNPRYSFYSMPSTIQASDVGKFLKAQSESDPIGSAVWAAISFTELPARTLATYPVRLSSAASTVTVTAATHGFDEIVDVMIWRVESGTYRKYEVDYQVIAATKSVVCDSSENWPANSYLVITGFKGTVVGD